MEPTIHLVEEEIPTLPLASKYYAGDRVHPIISRAQYNT